MGEAGRMRIKLQPEVFLQECGGGSAKRVEKYNGSERGREELGSKKGERRGDAGRGAGQVDWKGQPIRNLRGERGESEVRTRLSSFLFLHHRRPPSSSTQFFPLFLVLVLRPPSPLSFIQAHPLLSSRLLRHYYYYYYHHHHYHHHHPATPFLHFKGGARRPSPPRQ